LANRKVAVITGAAGGMGSAIARLVGRSHDLVLTDLHPTPLQQQSKQLTDEGYTVLRTFAGDICQADVLATLGNVLRERDACFALIHTAGLSPSLAGWRSILSVNLIATERLLASVELLLRPGAVAVAIASLAGHTSPAVAEIDALLDAPLAPDMLARLEPYLHQLVRGAPHMSIDGFAYLLSKRAVLRMPAQRVKRWAERGARIVSISPGLVWTTMGRSEEEGSKTDVAALLENTPLRRWGTAIEIAAAVEFLISDAAGYITGCDLRVDGGAVAALLGASAATR
jgi:NAD(P)-dependent dehydrogenase (short-subunit alcohol dehydrogenase family)